MRSLILLGLCLASSVAVAAPGSFQHQGRLSDSSGVAITGDHDLLLVFFDAPSGGTELWREELTTVEFDGGYYSVELGTSTAITPADIDSSEVYMEIALDGGTPLPDRLRLHSVPYAINATSVSGGVVNATEIQINGTTVIDSSGALASGVAYEAGTGLTLTNNTFAVDSAVLTPAWNNVQGVPADLAYGDNDTTYTAGAGLLLASGAFSVDNAAVQPAWSNVQGIPSDIADGDDDTDTTYSAGDGLALTGTTFSLSCGDGYTAVAGGRLCIQTAVNDPANIHTAIAECTKDQARVCTHNDMQQGCGVNGYNPYEGSAINGWYGDHALATGGNTDDEYLTYNRNACDPNNDGPAMMSTEVLHYRCCK